MRRFYVPLFVLGFVLLGGICSCSEDKGNGGGGGGTPREFASGDLNVSESYQHTFNTAKTVNYFCRYHGGRNGVGMSGTITVTETGGAELRNVSITDNVLPNITIAKGSTIRWTNNHNRVHTVESDN